MASLALDALAWDDAEELKRYTRWTATPEGGPCAESVFAIEGMYCSACSVNIEHALSQVSGVQSAEVNPGTRRAQVRWDPTLTQASKLAEAVERAGYRAYPATALHAEASRQREQRLMLWRLFVAGFCMMQVMMYAAPAYWATEGDMAPDIARLLVWASWILSIPVLVFAAGPFLRGAWADVRARRIGMDVPVALGVVVTFVASTGAAFEPGGIFGHEVYFDSLTMFVFFLLCGRYLEMRARDSTLGALDQLMLRLPETVERLLADGSSEQVHVARLTKDDRVRVRPGQAFPADGHLLEGETQVDEALLTGESRPVTRRTGQPLMAGSFNLSAPVVMQVERAGEDTRYAQIVALIARAATDRPAVVRQVDRIAGPFLWAVLVLALGAAVAWLWIDPSRSVWIAVAVLIVTCPCALSLATPSALLTSAGALARSGVLVQRLSALEALAHADLFVFDKTGTLTEDRLHLVDTVLSECWAGEVALAHARALAEASLHPVSRALAEATATQSATTLTGLRERAGQGVEGLDAEGRCWRLGSPRFALPELVVPPSDRAGAWLSVDGQLVAQFVFEERLREDARVAVQQLRAAGVQVMLLSGDQVASAQRVANSLGIDDVHAGVSPEDKLRIVSEAQAAGKRVAMVGDGVNDGPVLARADVSVAMGQGAALARAQADFTLLSGRLGDLVRARTLALKTLKVIRQNLAWAATYNAVCVPLAMLGLLPPWLAGLGMAGSSLLVVMNAQRLRRLPA